MARVPTLGPAGARDLGRDDTGGARPERGCLARLRPEIRFSDLLG